MKNLHEHWTIKLTFSFEFVSVKYFTDVSHDFYDIRQIFNGAMFETLIFALVFVVFCRFFQKPSYF